MKKWSIVNIHKWLLLFCNCKWSWWKGPVCWKSTSNCGALGLGLDGDHSLALPPQKVWPCIWGVLKGQQKYHVCWTPSLFNCLRTKMISTYLEVLSHFGSVVQSWDHYDPGFFFIVPITLYQVLEGGSTFYFCFPETRNTKLTYFCWLAETNQY